MGSIRDRLARVDDRILHAVVAILIAIACFAPRATVPALFVVFAVQLVASIRARSVPTFDGLIMAGFAGLIVWAYVSTNWALSSTLSPTTRLVPLFVAGFCLIGWANQRAMGPLDLDLVRAGFIVAALFYLFELISWAWLTRTLQGFEWRDILDESGGIPVKSYLINGVVILSLFAWPVIAMFVSAGRRFAAISLFVTVIALAMLFGSESATIAIIVGGLRGWVPDGAVRRS